MGRATDFFKRTGGLANSLVGARDRWHCVRSSNRARGWVFLD